MNEFSHAPNSFQKYLSRILHPMRQFGLIGKSLTHSFSKKYFEEKWDRQSIANCVYDLYEIESAESLAGLLFSIEENSGFNVTIPYKKTIINFLDELTPLASSIMSVNCIKKKDGKLIGHNTDGPAFLSSLKNFLPDNFHTTALLLSTGGASLAVQWALGQRNINFQLVSSSGKGLTYPELYFNWNPDWKFIINASPVGMWPNHHEQPALPYQFIDDSYYLYDLIYNPEKTLFLKLGAQHGACIKNGLEMLYLQADLSWQFWNE